MTDEMNTDIFTQVKKEPEPVKIDVLDRRIADISAQQANRQIKFSRLFDKYSQGLSSVNAQSYALWIKYAYEQLAALGRPPREHEDEDVFREVRAEFDASLKEDSAKNESEEKEKKEKGKNVTPESINRGEEKVSKELSVSPPPEKKVEIAPSSSDVDTTTSIEMIANVDAPLADDKEYAVRRWKNWEAIHTLKGMGKPAGSKNFEDFLKKKLEEEESSE